VRRICDGATILRHGKVVGTCVPSEETPATMARLMVGDAVAGITRPANEPNRSAQPAIAINALSRAPNGPFAIALRNINLNVWPGEVVGIAGVAGNGQGEFFEAVSGEARQEREETVVLNGKAMGRQGISQRRRAGAAFVPEERLGHGAAPGMTLSENLLLSRHATDRKAYLGKAGIVLRAVLSTTTARVTQAMDVRKGAVDPAAGSLSGGNLQKFIIGRELDRQPAVFIVNQPTWGVDAGASSRIRQALVDLARAGSGVLVISQDLDELFEISDAIAVMHDGGMSPRVPIAEATYESIGLLMGGEHTERHAAAEVAA
jgi:general nucleoside transport system ATP-binding protein